MSEPKWYDKPMPPQPWCERQVVFETHDGAGPLARCCKTATHRVRALSGGRSWLSCQDHVDRDVAEGRQYFHEPLEMKS